MGQARAQECRSPAPGPHNSVGLRLLLTQPVTQRSYYYAYQRGSHFPAWKNSVQLMALLLKDWNHLCVQKRSLCLLSQTREGAGLLPLSPQDLPKGRNCPISKPEPFSRMFSCLTSQLQEALSSEWVKEAMVLACRGQVTVGRDEVQSWPQP